MIKILSMFISMLTGLILIIVGDGLRSGLIILSNIHADADGMGIAFIILGMVTAMIGVFYVIEWLQKQDDKS